MTKYRDARRSKTGHAVVDCSHHSEGCQWRNNAAFLPTHLAQAHGKLTTERKHIFMRQARAIGTAEFFVAKYPPSFEECLRLDDQPHHFFFDFETPLSSEKLKEYYRDKVRGLVVKHIGGIH